MVNEEKPTPKQSGKMPTVRQPKNWTMVTEVLPNGHQRVIVRKTPSKRK